MKLHFPSDLRPFHRFSLLRYKLYHHNFTDIRSQWEQNLQTIVKYFNLSSCHPRSFSSQARNNFVQWDIKLEQLLNRNLDTYQNTLLHVTKCYCPEACKLIKSKIYDTKEQNIAFDTMVTSFIWKCSKVPFSSCAT